MRCQVLPSTRENTVRIPHTPTTSSKNLAQFLHASHLPTKSFWEASVVAPGLGVVMECASVLVLIFFEHAYYRLYVCIYISIHVLEFSPIYSIYIFFHLFVYR